MKQEPMIAPLAFQEHTPESWIAFVRSLKIEPARKVETPPKAKRTKKGKVSLTLPRGREPKWILFFELETLSRETGIPMNELYNEAKKKELMIIKTALKKEKK